MTNQERIDEIMLAPPIEPSPELEQAFAEFAQQDQRERTVWWLHVGDKQSVRFLTVPPRRVRWIVSKLTGWVWSPEILHPWEYDRLVGTWK